MARRRRSFFFDNVNKKLLTDTTKNTKDVKDDVDAAVVANNNIVTLSDVEDKISTELSDGGYATQTYVNTAVADIVNSAPSTLNTLDELAAALGDDANFATSTATSLGNRLRIDTAAQGLTGTQQTNALTNLGITSTVAELNYTDGVTSNIQTQLDAKASTSQLNAKANLSGATFTGSVSVTGGTSNFNVASHDGATNGLQLGGILVTATAAEINKLDGVTATTAELNKLDGVTATTAELNILDGVTATAVELNKLDGLTATTAELNILDGVTATTAELNYTDGVTSNIQTQLNAKANLAGATFTGLIIGRTTTNASFTAANDAGTLSVRGSTTYPAVISFHRTSSYAVQFGLDTDNHLKMGGWSASTIKHTWQNSGNYLATGNITAYSSDKRLKTNIVNISDALNKVLSLNGVTFDWKDEVQNLGFTPTRMSNEIGVIAQEVEAVLPQATAPAPFDLENDNGQTVSRSGENYLTVQYEKIVPLLIEAIKEQQAQIEELKEMIGGASK